VDVLYSETEVNVEVSMMIALCDDKDQQTEFVIDSLSWSLMHHTCGLWSCFYLQWLDKQFV